MTDPTEFVLFTCFLAALGIFAGSAVARSLLLREIRSVTHSPAPIPEILETPLPIPVSAPPAPAWSPDSPESPYETPGSQSSDLLGASPLPPATGKVPTHIYRPIDLLGAGVVYLLFFGLVVGSARAAQQSHLVLDPVAIASSIGFQFFLAGMVALMVVRRIHPVDWLGLRWKQWPWVLLIAPATVVGMWLIFGALQYGGYMKWIESLGVESVQDTVKLLQESTDPLLLGLMAFAAVIAAPLCEEIVFRGYLYPIAKRFSGPWVAGACSALVFAAAHGSLSALLPLFLFGVVLVVIYEKTGSLWAPIAVHFCFNGATVVVQMAARFLEIPIDSPQPQ